MARTQEFSKDGSIFFSGKGAENPVETIDFTNPQGGAEPPKPHLNYASGYVYIPYFKKKILKNPYLQRMRYFTFLSHRLQFIRDLNFSSRSLQNNPAQREPGRGVPPDQEGVPPGQVGVPPDQAGQWAWWWLELKLEREFEYWVLRRHQKIGILGNYNILFISFLFRKFYHQNQ